MFLKRIEMQGFKSFADKTVISLNDQIIGIVGPNGCGKSNISDAIRWVLGEQSVKSLRGSLMSDIIFSGSEKRKAVNFSEVKLIFDNSSQIFDLPFTEVELGRKISRFSGENEYTINQSPCRLKDILELVLDIGIGRDALSIISQGNIQAFAEAKPQERRLFFEEAAGVAKYKRRKLEASSKLERTQDNLTRLNDIINELENQYSPLKRQAKKANLYREKKAVLEEIEVSVLVAEISSLNQEIKGSNDLLFTLQSSSAAKEASINVHDVFCLKERENLKIYDRNIQKNSEALVNIAQEIQVHEAKKSELEVKLGSSLPEKLDQSEQRRLQYEYQEVKLELEDRTSRLEHFNQQSDLAQEEIISCKNQGSELQIKSQQLEKSLRKYENQLSYLKQISADPYYGQSGVKTITKNPALSGILGVVGDLIKAESDYEEVIAAALGPALYYLVCSNQASSKQALGYLRKNEAGRATILSLPDLQAEKLSSECRLIVENHQGWLGYANSFIEANEELTTLGEYLLADVLVVEDLESGEELNRLLKQQYTIVTLAGEVIHRGGARSGGKEKAGVTLLSLKRSLEETTLQLNTVESELTKLRQQSSELLGRQTIAEENLLEAKLNIVSLTPIIEAKSGKLTKLEYDLKTANIDAGALTLDEASAEIIAKLNELYARRDELNSSLSKDRENRLMLAKEIDNRDKQMRLLRRELAEESSRVSELQIKLARDENQIENLIFRLTSDYQMSFEAAQEVAISVDSQARQQALDLRNELTALGNINLDAPEQFAVVSERYEFLSKQVEELSGASAELLAIIKEMDEVMKERFSALITEINEVLPGVFQKLFGGGKAALSLDDPDDLLNSGVDINVHPPGKTIANIRLFSGGEKTLIAISVLFAILKIKPVPLCILDEAETALDQSNVERFAFYLKEISPQTQFIVITHRPGTMVKCDSLYGVTMSRDGVSQLLKVKLSQAMEYAQEDNNGNI